jgi:hypothetical protein
MYEDLITNTCTMNVKLSEKYEDYLFCDLYPLFLYSLLKK